MRTLFVTVDPAHPPVSGADLRSWQNALAASALGEVTLRAGSGTRIKALEAMAWGLPIVATALAVEGLGLVPGVHYRAAETTRGFAGAITGLADDASACAAQRAAARAHAIERYGPAAIAAAVRRALAGGPWPGESVAR